MRRLLIALLLAGPTTLFAAEGSFEKTIPVPRDRDAKLGWAHQGCRVASVTLRNYPDQEDIDEARAKDPGDKSWLWWEFNVANQSDRKCKITLSVEVLDRKGNVVKSSDRSGSVSPGESDDDIRVSTLMKTLEIADAPKVRLRGTITSK
ncbi:MAG TPA: hypothetical protein VGQ75_05270 [Thermoanaerobaculia bacterium]|jgi:hypothetical protein|nr:hypothetical protein [Thermoanaerobaculia bacterium]